MECKGKDQSQVLVSIGRNILGEGFNIYTHETKRLPHPLLLPLSKSNASGVIKCKGSESPESKTSPKKPT